MILARDSARSLWDIGSAVLWPTYFRKVKANVRFRCLDSGFGQMGDYILYWDMWYFFVIHKLPVYVCFARTRIQLDFPLIWACEGG